MKKFFAALMLCLFVTTTAFAASTDEERRQVDELSARTLAKLYERYPGARYVIQNCYAYATLSNSGVKVLFIGSAHGRGVAVNHGLGQKVYVRMKELSAGLGLGAKEYDLVFLINTREAWEDFIAGKTRFAASAQASADDSFNGGSLEGATYVAPAVWVYQMTTKGLALEAELKGTKIYRDKKLSPYN